MTNSALAGILLLAGCVGLAAGCSKPAARTAPPKLAASPTPLPASLQAALHRGDRVRVDAPSASFSGQPIRTVLNVRAPMTYGEFVWHDEGVPAGPVWVRIDLPRQVLSVFRSGDEIGTAVILYGADKKPTPIGTFPVLAKFKDHRSGPYDAPMPYTLRLTADGVSIHGSNVRWGAATHGCIGVPKDFAAKLFAVVPTGGRVTILGQEPSAPSPHA